MRFSILLTALLFPLLINAQYVVAEAPQESDSLEEMSFSEVITMIFDTIPEEEVRVNKKKIIIGRNYYYWTKFNFPDAPRDSLGRIVVEKDISFINCIIDDKALENFHFKGRISLLYTNGMLRFRNTHISGYHVQGVKLDRGVSFNNLTFDDLFFYNSSIKNAEEFSINSCKINGLISVELNGFSSVNISNNRIGNEFIQARELERDTTSNMPFYFSRDNLFILDDISQVDFINNKIYPFSDTVSNKFVVKSSNVKNAQFELNDFFVPFLMFETSFQDRLIIKKNVFKSGFGFNKTLLPELYIDIRYDDLRNTDFFIYKEDVLRSKKWGDNEVLKYPYYGKLDAELRNEDGFLELLDMHAKLYHIYKQKADIIASNQMFIRIQELYTNRYRVKYEDNKRLSTLFRWRLNQLLNLYADYGTDPSKAVLISCYIVVFFSIFYFFFPSDWDRRSIKESLQLLGKSNPSKLPKKIRQFTVSLFQKLVNALALSLNAFVTLGFGNIPTTGLPRYVCIIQGFIGWFLLSIFTVALINQVIY